MNISSELRTRIISGCSLGATVVLLTLWSFWGFAAMCTLGGGIIMKEWWGLTKHRSRWWILPGVVYIGAAMASLIFLRGNLNLIIYLFAVVWGGDSAAYLIGRKIGRHKIAPAISPGKSWEGLIASIIAGASISVIFAYATLTEPQLYILSSATLGASLSIIGLAGDLFESALKRRANVKDSGRLIPGHGGLFDRVDAIMPCAIFTALALYSRSM